MQRSINLLPPVVETDEEVYDELERTTKQISAGVFVVALSLTVALIADTIDDIGQFETPPEVASTQYSDEFKEDLAKAISMWRLMSSGCDPEGATFYNDQGIGVNSGLACPPRNRDTRTI